MVKFIQPNGFATNAVIFKFKIINFPLQLFRLTI